MTARLLAAIARRLGPECVLSLVAMLTMAYVILRLIGLLENVVG